MQNSTRACKTCGKSLDIEGKRKPPLTAQFCSRTCHYTCRDPLELFLQKVNKTPSCWIWTGLLNRGGYGHFGHRKFGGYAHRASWRLQRGPVPKGLLVLHNCPGGDNRMCVNPDHLWLGTYADNALDAYRKHQMKPQPGESHGSHKLTDNDVYQIRASKEHTTQTELAKKFAVTQSVISRIQHRKAWRHLP